jgi:putative transposase
MGELKKLGITPPSKNTVKNILKAVGLDPGPQRGEGTWDEFLTRHAASLWQCDFFSRNVLTTKGIRQAFVLAFLNVKTRRVILLPATYKPDAEWVEAQAEAFVDQARGEGLPVARLMRDNDGAFSTVFDEALRRKHVTVKKTQFRSPNMNAFAERFVQSIKQECLDHFVVFGAEHMDVLCSEYLEYYHTERPHQGRENELLVGNPPQRGELLKLSDVRCTTRLGGLLKSYQRKAA